jgi:MFS family permease
MATAAVGRSSGEFGLRRHLALAAFWFGGNYHWGPILPILLPFQILHLVPKSEQGSSLGLMLGIGSFFAMVVPPLVGHLSDGFHSRYGRRRPIMVVGTAVNVVGLVLMFAAPTYTLLLLAYLVVQISNNAAGAAFNAVVPDVVPPAEFGRQSGLLGGMVQLGTVGGLATYIALSIAGAPLVTYIAIAVVLLLTLVPTVWAARGEGLTPVEKEPPMPPMAALKEFFRPLVSGDFGWVVFTRLMVTGGIWCVLPFLQFFFSDVGHIAHADQFTSFWELTLLLAATPFGLVGGWVSDRYGRKIFVYASGACQGLAVVIFIVLFPTQVVLIFAIGVLFGVGYGLYYAVDWALACDTLPDARHAAKDMGLFHVAFTFPQVVLPSVLGFVLDAFNRNSPNSGFRVVFAVAVVFFVVGTVFVSRIRSVR